MGSREIEEDRRGMEGRLLLRLTIIFMVVFTGQDNIGGGGAEDKRE